MDRPFSVSTGDCLNILRSLPDQYADSVVTDPPAGISFMGKAWDSDRGGRDQWIAWMQERAAECLRVARPGAHALVWALPRTAHWTATAWENAGWEVRDCLSHIFGTGFPKSLNISKAIDREMGATRPVIGTIRTHDVRGGRLHAGGSADSVEYERTAPGSPEAVKWDGYGSALKPSVENWYLLRRPIAEENIARNVLLHGTGGINVDGCRVGDGGQVRWTRPRGLGYDGGSPPDPGAQRAENELGRWPTNLLLSHGPGCTDDTCAEGCPVRILDEQSGGASRFYPTFRYVPKPGRTERDRGLGHRASGLKHRVNPGGLEHDPRWGPTEAKNMHPTTKAVDLMTWLVRLVTPPGGLVLDPFCGSGSTGVAAVASGFRFHGIDLDEQWVGVAWDRMAHAHDHLAPVLLTESRCPNSTATAEQLMLLEGM